ncbi:MAG: MarC family protein [Phycisphaerales bacterium]
MLDTHARREDDRGVSDWLDDFILLFTIIDPIGSVPVFIAIARRAPRGLRLSMALRSVGIALFTLLFFIALGKPLLDAIGIDLNAFRIAGGIVLFLFAIDMIFGQSKPEREVLEVDRETALDMAVYPMAIPSIAGPGAILAVVVLSEEAPGLSGSLRVAGMTVAVLACVLVALLAADRIERMIGDVGASIISRIMGLIVAAIAVQAIMTGIGGFFGIGPTP